MYRTQKKYRTIEEYNQDYIFFVNVFFKSEGKKPTNKNPKKDNNRKYYSTYTVNNFSYILFCRYYVDFNSDICLYLIKPKFIRKKDKKQFESCVLKIDFLSLSNLNIDLAERLFGKILRQRDVNDSHAGPPSWQPWPSSSLPSRELAVFSWVPRLPAHLMKGLGDLGTRFASSSLLRRKLLGGQVRSLWPWEKLGLSLQLTVGISALPSHY